METQGLMYAMQMDAPNQPLRRVERPVPMPGPGEIRIAISACGMCRTDLHIFEGDIHGRLPIVPGHEIVGKVEALGEGVSTLGVGQRVGVPWLGHSCRTCDYCRSDRENLCDVPQFTGFTRDGGYASHCVADARYCFALPDAIDDIHAAPLLCAGLIGHRAYRMAGDALRVGLFGFGAAAHIIAQVALWQGRHVYAFSRPGDEASREFALSLGCTWAGPSDEDAPEKLDAAIIFAPVGELVPRALRAVRKGGRVICAGIHMSDIPSFAYADLWEERSIQSVANLTREDGLSFMALAAQAPIATHVTPMPLVQANEAMERLRSGKVRGAIVLLP